MRPGLQRVLDTISGPAYMRNLRGDILALNRLGRALFSDGYGDDAVGFNIAPLSVPGPRLAHVLPRMGERGA